MGLDRPAVLGVLRTSHRPPVRRYSPSTGPPGYHPDGRRARRPLSGSPLRGEQTVRDTGGLDQLRLLERPGSGGGPRRTRQANDWRHRRSHPTSKPIAEAYGPPESRPRQGGQDPRTLRSRPTEPGTAPTGPMGLRPRLASGGDLASGEKRHRAEPPLTKCQNLRFPPRTALPGAAPGWVSMAGTGRGIARRQSPGVEVGDLKLAVDGLAQF